MPGHGSNAECSDQDVQLLMRLLRRYPSLASAELTRLMAGSRADPPLENPALLKRILELLGTKAWIYTAGVSRSWRGCYLSICHSAAAAKGQELRYLTNWQNAAGSLSRLRMALQFGIKAGLPQAFSIRIGEHILEHSSDPQQSLTLCKLHDMPWSASMTRLAARRDDYSMMLWLIESGCAWDAGETMRHVIRNCPAGARLTLLQRLWAQQPALAAAEKQRVMSNAALFDDLEAVQWLRRSVRCAWPKGFWCIKAGQSPVDFKSDPVRGKLYCWGPRCLAWARETENGAGWGNWRCERFNEAWYDEGLDAQYAREVFAWAHASRCPCTCGDDSADEA